MRYVCVCVHECVLGALTRSLTILCESETERSIWILSESEYSAIHTHCRHVLKYASDANSA